MKGWHVHSQIIDMNNESILIIYASILLFQNFQNKNSIISALSTKLTLAITQTISKSMNYFEMLLAFLENMQSYYINIFAVLHEKLNSIRSLFAIKPVTETCHVHSICDLEPDWAQANVYFGVPKIFVNMVQHLFTIVITTYTFHETARI